MLNHTHKTSYLCGRALCAVLMILLLAACGSVRKLTGDEDVLPPEDLVAVALVPVDDAESDNFGASGTTGDTVVFATNAVVKNGAEAEYAWDLGSGAAPQFSSLPNPVAVLGAARTMPYAGTITVTTLRPGHQVQRTYAFEYVVQKTGLMLVTDIYPLQLIAGQVQKLQLGLDDPEGMQLVYDWDLSALDTAYDHAAPAPEFYVPVQSDKLPHQYTISVRVWPVGHELDKLELERTVTVQAGTETALSMFGDVYPKTVQAGKKQQFGIAVYARNGATVRYAWDFGELGAEYDPSLAMPEFTVESDLPTGLYKGSVRVWLDSGENTMQSKTFTINVIAAPPAAKPELILGNNVYPQTVSSGAVRQRFTIFAMAPADMKLCYVWDFGTFGSDYVPGDASPNVTLTPGIAPGVYTINVKVWLDGDAGSIQERSFDITVI